MEKIQFTLSLLVAICGTIQFGSAIINPSPMKNIWVIGAGIMLLLCCLLIKITYKELRAKE